MLPCRNFAFVYDTQIDVTNPSTAGDVSNYVSNGEWDLLELPVVVNQAYYTCCPEPYPDVTFTLVLQRRGRFYVINLFLPVFFMVNAVALGVGWGMQKAGFPGYTSVLPPIENLRSPQKFPKKVLHNLHIN